NIDTNGDGTADATVTADGAGNWTYTPTAPLADGTVVEVTATDAAGNTSAPATETVDAAAPSAPSIDTVVDDVDPVSAPLTSGDSTND
ncbi:Ig-like domain-containing protein, partial [Campylobacter jejuni]